MGEFVRMDDRRRVTLPLEMAELFSEGIIRVKKQKDKVVLEPVHDPFGKFKGLLKAKKPIRELRDELDGELSAGEIGL
ncbi:hypothetical protein HY572_02255 [Candidatus Micrarchaeota archaeon]|nr:hypothetical protein [Candidatus Micrarchaeota archaeon]